MDALQEMKQVSVSEILKENSLVVPEIVQARTSIACIRPR